LHAYTGTNRFEYRRAFSDSSYFPVRLRNELSFAGPGVSVGVVAEPTEGLRLSGMARWDADLKLNKDSTRVAEVPMPVTLAAGAQWASRRLVLGGHLLWRGWSVQDDYLIASGGTGASDTFEATLGGQLASSRRQPGRWPLRLGARWSALPYPIALGGDAGSEFGVSIGTGAVFSGGRATLDLAVERTWRSEGSAYRERSFMATFGVGIRP
jgi:hypothetical protein